MEQFGTLNWIIVGAYLVGNLFLGYWMSRKVKSASDFQLGTRTLPWWAIGISVIATYVSALSFLGGPAWAYGDGMAALAIHINYPLVIFVVVVLFLPFFYNSGVASIYEYLERRFGPTSRSVMAILFLVTQVITTASILTATAFVITYATGVNIQLAIIGMALVVLVYTMLGGMNAVIWTDVLQGVILFIGAGIVLWGLLSTVSPLSSALDTLATEGKLDPINTSFDLGVDTTIWAGVFAMTLFHITVYGANQMMVQRALAAKNIGDAKKSYLMMGFAAFFIYFLFFFIGALLFVHFGGKAFDEPNQIILVFAESLAVPGLMGIIAAAVLSASMSSLSSAFNSLATISVTDFYQRYLVKEKTDSHYLWATRFFTLIWCFIAIPIAFAFVSSDGSILKTLTEVGSYLVGAKLAMFGLGFLSKHTNEKGLLIGVVAGFIALMIAGRGVPGTSVEPLGLAWPWNVVIGGGVNIIVSWIASVLIEGRKHEWHPQTVPGQMHKFESEAFPATDDGWYVIPGKVDRVVWLLPILFVAIIAFLAWFGTLGTPA